MAFGPFCAGHLAAAALEPGWSGWRRGHRGPRRQGTRPTAGGTVERKVKPRNAAKRRAGRSCATSSRINCVRPLTDRVPLVRAEGRTVHVGNRMATAEGRLFGADGKLYAHASTTCFLFDAPT